MNKKLIKKLRKGTIAVLNDGTLEELREVLKYAFPEDITNSEGAFKYYYKRPYLNEWGCKDKTNLPTHSVKEFLTQETKTMKVTDLKQNECIHCETEEQANAICKLMHKAGFKWCNGKTYLYCNDYNSYKSESCYIPKEGMYCSLKYAKRSNYTIYKAEQFLNQNTKTMSTIVNINPYTSEINITPKEGFEIDLENSDLKNGKVVLKKVEKKYPSEFGYYKEEDSHFYLSDKYGYKLEILDTLLCLRDEYNRIDGFTEGFKLGEENWCILPYKCELKVSRYVSINKIIHFGKEETARLFLKNFEEQLETVKEFL